MPRSVELNPAPEELFWYWVNERHRIFVKRSEGQPKPWTEDPILRDYKFTNVFRELDRGTVWLRENFLEPHAEASKELLIFNVCWYRMFNWIGTGELLGWQNLWDPEKACALLEKALAEGRQVFTGAHIVRSEFDRPKIPATIDVCTALWDRRQKIAGTAHETNSLEHTFYELLPVTYVGPFMAYEMVTDFRHTKVLNNAFDILTWANAGPGALRGLKRLTLPCKNQTEAVQSMLTLLERSQWAKSSWVPSMEMRDIEHSLCEFDKYCRIKFGEGKPRGRYLGAA